VPEYIPKRVDAVRFRIDRVLLGEVDSKRLLVSRSGFMASGAGEGGWEELLEAGVISNVRRGIGRWIWGISIVAGY
jgi:hypothetical protein